MRTINRGIRQGCPLSLYLYLIYIEPLHLRLQKEINGITIRKANIKTSGYVDDIIIFTEDIADFTKVDQILTLFESCSNTLLNRKKTKYMEIGLWKEKHILTVQWLNQSPYLKLLGIKFYQTITETIK